MDASFSYLYTFRTSILLIDFLAFSVQDDDENLSDNKLNNNNGSHKRLRKKYQVSESENEDILQESEDEDTCLLSALKKKTDVKPVASEDNQKNDMLSAEVPHRTENGGTVESKTAK